MITELKCLFQVFDMLCAAGLGQHDYRMGLLLNVARICPTAMDQFYHVLRYAGQPDTASKRLLSKVAMRGKWANVPRYEKAAIVKLEVGKPTHFDFQIADTSGYILEGESTTGMRLFSPP